MGYKSISPLAYKSTLKFTIDGRPTVNDIHKLFSSLMSQVVFTTHRYMFRTYSYTFTSEDAITELGSLQYSAVTAAKFSTLNVERDMAKALIQQFLWTRLIENTVEPLNRSYRDKGIWRVRSKGLCVLQDYCIKTNNIELLVQFKKYVDISLSEPMFLIHVERIEENDRLNRKRNYFSCLFAIMVASLPLGDNNNNQSNTKIHSRQLVTPSTIYSGYGYNGGRRKSSHSDLYSTFSDKTSLSRHASISSSEFYSASSTSYNSQKSASSNASQEASCITDYFPHIKILPNDLLVYPNPLHQSSDSSIFQQQKSLLQNLIPSPSNKFKMRTVFSSSLCCNWLVGYCTVASTDEAESIMTELLKLGWITFYDDKYKNCDQIESSKSMALRLTGTGMKIVMDVSVEQYSDFQRQNQQVSSQSEQFHSDDMGLYDKRYSIASSSFSHATDSTFVSSILSNFDEMSIMSTLPRSSLQHTNSSKNISPYSPHSTPQLYKQNKDYEGMNYFDINPTTLMTTPYPTNCNNIRVHFEETHLQHSNNSSLLTTNENNIAINERNAIKLKSILKDPVLRPLFREFLDENLCAENFDFWIEYKIFRRQYQNNQEFLTMMSDMKHQQLLQEAYILWDTYLCPGANMELYVNNTLREEMAEDISQIATLVNTGTGSKSVQTIIISTHSTYDSLLTILNWFDQVDDQVCKFMAADLVSKFMCTAEYKVAEKMSPLRHEEDLEQQQIQHELQQQYSAAKIAAAVSDLDDFPPPPQRLKETIFL